MQTHACTRVALAFVLFLAACGPTQAPTHPSSPDVTTAAQANLAVPTAERTRLPTLTPRPPSKPVPSTTPRPTQTPLPTETPRPTLSPPAFSGTLYVQRNREIIALDLASQSIHSLGICTDAFQISPDSRWLALVSGDDLEVMDVSGQTLQPITQGVDGEFVWAPDSRAIAFVKGAKRDRLPGCPTTAEIWVVELPSWETRRIDAGCEPAWSPDSTRIAYVSSYDGFKAGVPNTLYLVNRYGEHRWSPYQPKDSSWLSPGLGYDTWPSLYNPFWSADGRSILVAALYREWSGDIVLSTLEQVDAHQGGGETIGIMLDWHYAIPSPDGKWAMEPWIGETGGGNVTLYNLSSEEGCVESRCCWLDEQWCAEVGSKLSVQKQNYFDFTERVAWSPDGQFLAITYCPDEMGNCHGPELLQVRILGPFTGGLSDPLPISVDPNGGIAWRPSASPTSPATELTVYPALPSDLFYLQDGKLWRWPKEGGRPEMLTAGGGAAGGSGPIIYYSLFPSVHKAVYLVSTSQVYVLDWSTGKEQGFSLNNPVDVAFSAEHNCFKPGGDPCLYVPEAAALTPDGQYLVYLSWSYGPDEHGEVGAGIRVAPLDHPGAENQIAQCGIHEGLGFWGGCRQFLLSPDGSRVVFRDGQGVWVVAIPQGQPRLLFQNEAVSEASEYLPPHISKLYQWSPDGQYVLVRVAGFEWENWSILDTYSGQLTEVPNSSEFLVNYAEAAWGPTGIWVGWGEKEGTGTILRYEIAGPNELQLAFQITPTEPAQIWPRSLLPLPDGSLALANRRPAAAPGPESGLYLLQSDGRLQYMAPLPLPPDCAVSDPKCWTNVWWAAAWGNVSWSADGTAFVYQDKAGQLVIGFADGSTLWDMSATLQGATMFRWGD